MFVKQLSVFMENKPGRLFHLTKTLGESGVDLVTLSIADTKDFGIVRFIARDNKKALEAVKKAGFTASETELIGVEIKDEPGALSRVLGIFNDSGISIEYLYSFVLTGTSSAKILLRVEDTKRALELLERENIPLLNEKFL